MDLFCLLACSLLLYVIIYLCVDLQVYFTLHKFVFIITITTATTTTTTRLLQLLTTTTITTTVAAAFAKTITTASTVTSTISGIFPTDFRITCST